MVARSPEQKASLRQAYQLLAAQFEDVLIVCSMDEDDGSLGTDTEVYWKGGFNHASSLADAAKDKLNRQRRPENKPL